MQPVERRNVSITLTAFCMAVALAFTSTTIHAANNDAAALKATKATAASTAQLPSVSVSASKGSALDQMDLSTSVT